MRIAPAGSKPGRAHEPQAQLVRFELVVPRASQLGYRLGYRTPLSGATQN